MKLIVLLRWLLTLLTGIGLAGCASQPGAGMYSEDAENAPRPYAIDVVNHGWHTGLVLPAREIRERLPQLVERFPDAPYLEFGWGDSAFYQADRGTAGLALRALLWPTDSVMHVVAVPDDAQRHFSSSPQQRLCLTRRQYLALAGFVIAGFAVNEGQEILPLRGGLYGDSQFYRAQGKYHLFNTCNTWLAKGLREAGLPVNPTLMVTAENLLNFLRAQQTKYENRTANNNGTCD